MPNPYTFVNWGVLGVIEKEPSQRLQMPGYKISICELQTPWDGYGLEDAKRFASQERYRSNKRYLGYATPTQAKDFFTTLINKIERHNANTPVKKYKIRFLKSLSHEPDWTRMKEGALTYSFYKKPQGWRNHRIFIHFKPYHPPKPKTVKPFEQRIAELNYSTYGL